ncbi:MAG: hypothetical protein AB7Q16_19680 [Vicinamibacterales bacterium]
MRRFIIAALASVVIVATGAAQPSPVSAWRATHEWQILDELLQLVSIPGSPVVFATLDVPSARATSPPCVSSSQSIPRTTPNCWPRRRPGNAFPRAATASRSSPRDAWTWC